jgi:hypothetical protein
MKRIIAIQALVVVILAIGAIAPVAASASLPELVNSKDEALVKSKFTGTGGSTRFETVGRTQLSCSSGSVSGRMTGVKTAEATLTFTGCEVLAKNCHSKGAKSGEIINSGAGKIVYTDKATKAVGLLVEMEKGREVKCGETSIFLRGAIVGAIGPVNKLQSSYTNTWSERDGVQELTKYENEKGELESAIWETSIEEGSWEQTGLEGTGKVTFEEMAEIKA